MFEMILGHFMGDYLFQSKHTALNKSKNTMDGWMLCIFHCIIYTVTICAMMQQFKPIWVAAVFFSHFFIDKFSLAMTWLHSMGGRTFKEIQKDYSGTDFYTNIDLAFTCLVYTVVDNTMHILIMYLAYRFIFHV